MWVRVWVRVRVRLTSAAAVVASRSSHAVGAG